MHLIFPLHFRDYDPTICFSLLVVEINITCEIDPDFQKDLASWATKNDIQF